MQPVVSGALLLQGRRSGVKRKPFFFAHASSDVKNSACSMNAARTNCWMTG